MGAVIMTALRAMPLVVQLSLGLGIIGAIGGGYAYWHHEIYQSGVDDTLTAVAAQNKEGLDAANKLKAEVFDCAARGGSFDQSRWLCEP